MLPTELSFTSVLARAPMLDTARAVGGRGQVAAAGVLNQAAPCFALSSHAASTGSRITVRLIATEKPGTCATFAAGAFDYSVAVKGLSPGSYDVELFHRADFQDGRIADTKILTTRLEVR